jgi:hypothetical protein
MRELEILAVAALALGASHFLNYLALRRDRREQRSAVHAWEAEGGAVPTSRTSTTAMEVRPA